MIVGHAGPCVTNQETIDIMEEQEQIKRKKMSDKVREKNKQKQKQEIENNRKLKLVKKQNAQRKKFLCGKNK
jgi:hypothetical protein